MVLYITNRLAWVIAKGLTQCKILNPINKAMNKLNGRKRVIITNVSPQIEEGKYSVKTIINEDLMLSADIFVDGHDDIKASVFVKHEKDRLWKEFPLKLVENDHWEVIIIPERTGFYYFKMQAWPDHFTTWQKGLQKKFNAQQDIRVELKIGSEMLTDTAVMATPKDQFLVTKWAAELNDTANADNTEPAVLLALSDEVSQIMGKYKDKTLVTTHDKVFKIEAEQKKALFSTWYELFPRSTSPKEGNHGTFKDVKRILPRIARMGFDVLYFPPIHPIGEKNRKGKNNSLIAEPESPGSPWAIGNKMGGHKTVHPQLGTLKDFKNLLAEARKFNIDIALDIAYQCAPDHPYVKEHPQWFKWRPDGSVQYAENPPKKYEDILPFYFETEDWQNLWKELKSIIDYWINQGVTIFRIDNPHTKPFLFWEWLIREVRREHPQIIFLAEAFTRPRSMEKLAKVGFNQSYTYFTWRNTKMELEEYITQLTKTDLRYYFRPNFWVNTPDILPPYLTSGGESAHIIRLLLAATLSSNYGLYGPVYEFGINTPHGSKEEYTNNEKYEIKNWNWDEYTRIGEIITRINKIRKQNSALQTTWNIEFGETTNDQIICYGKVDKTTKNRLIFAVNLDPHHVQSGYVKVPIQHLGIQSEDSYTVRDLLSGDKYRWHGEWNFVELNPYEMPAHVLRIEL